MEISISSACGKRKQESCEAKFFFEQPTLLLIMSDSEDPFESSLLGKVKKNRRAVKRKAENQADREIMDLIEKRERRECEKQSEQSVLIGSKNDEEVFNDNGSSQVCIL